MPDIIQQLLDLKEWSQDSARYERRMNFRAGQLVQPGPGRVGLQRGTLASAPWYRGTSGSSGVLKAPRGYTGMADILKHEGATIGALAINQLSKDKPEEETERVQEITQTDWKPSFKPEEPEPPKKPKGPKVGDFAKEIMIEEILNRKKNLRQMDQEGKIDFVKYFEKFAELYHGGNASAAARELNPVGRWGQQPKNFKAGEWIRSIARRAGHKLKTVGQGEIGDVLTDVTIRDKTIASLTDKLSKDPLYLTIEVEDDEYYTVSNTLRKLGIEPTELNKQLFTMLTREKGTEGASPKSYKTNITVRQKDSGVPGRPFYNLKDIISNVENFALKSGPGGGPKTITGEYEPAFSWKNRIKAEKQIDPDFHLLKNKFQRWRFLGQYQKGDEAVSKLMKSGKKMRISGVKFKPETGLNPDWGHAFNLRAIEGFDFIKNSEINQNKMYPLSSNVRQDTDINQKILLDEFKAKDNGLMKKIDSFLKENKVWDEETIKKAEELNSLSKNLLKKKYERIDEWVKSKEKKEPYLSGQQNTIQGLQLKIRPGKKITIEDIIVDKTYFKPGKHSIGKINVINEKAVKLKDLSPKQLEEYQNAIIDQELTYLVQMGKAANFPRELMRETIESMLHGWEGGTEGISRKGYLTKRGIPDFAEGGSVPRTGYQTAGSVGKTAGKGILRKALGWFGADIGFYYLEKWNEMSKGKSEEEAAAMAMNNATLGVYKNKTYIEGLKKTAKEMGIDSRAFENVYKMNEKMAKVQKEHQRYQGMIEKLEGMEAGPERDARLEQITNAYNNWEQNMDPEIKKWQQGILDDISISKTGGIASPLELSKARESLIEDDWYKPFIDIQDVALKKLEKEKAAAYDMQSKQVDPEAGNIGNWLNTNIFTLDPRGKAKEQKHIEDMLDFDPRELYRYNLERGLDPDNPLTWEAYRTLKSAHPGLGFREESAGGGIAGLSGGKRFGPPPLSGPMPQGGGLSSQYNRVKKLTG